MKRCHLIAPLTAAGLAVAGPALAGATANLGIAYPTPGADDSVWGAILNSALQAFDNEWKVEALGDASLVGSSSTRIVRLTTTFTAARTITLPAANTHAANQPVMVLDPVGAVNGANTLLLQRTGADTIESPGAAGATSYLISVPRRAVVLRSDGASRWLVAADLGSLARQDASSVAITGGTIAGITDLAVADGGTGAGAPSAARVNLGAAASGANGDITSLSGLSTPLSLGQGGTGAGTASGARANLGVAAPGADTAYAFRSNNLSDLGSLGTARANLGVTATGADVTYAFRANNLSDLANLATARANLGLGSSSSPTFAGLAATADTALGDGNSDTATVTGHLASSGSAPTVSSCGTSPSITAGANDQRGYVTNGGGTVVVCSVTFSRAFANPPICTLSINSNSPVMITGFNGPPSTTGFTASFGSNYAGGGWFYICLG